MRKHLSILSILIMLINYMVYSPAQAQTKFSDVDEHEYQWVMDAINFMAGNGILSGYPDGTFKPQNPITKAELTVMMYKLFDKYRPNTLPETNNSNRGTRSNHIAGFEDVPNQYWAYKEIHEIYNHSFEISAFAYDENREKQYFLPDKKLTRLQLAEILNTGFGRISKINHDNLEFKTITAMKDIPYKIANSDEELTGYQRDGRYTSNGDYVGYYATNDVPSLFPILFMKKYDGTNQIYDDASGIPASGLSFVYWDGIMTIDDAGNFRPLDYVTRAEASTILLRVLNDMDEKGMIKNYSSLKGTGAHNPIPSPATQTEQTAYVKPLDYPDENGQITKNLKKSGEIETVVNTAGYQTMRLSLQSKEKADLHLKFNGKTAFIRQEELPMTIQLNEMDEEMGEVRIITQLRSPNDNKIADYKAILTIELIK